MKKIKSNKGFSLFEATATLLIISLLTISITIAVRASTSIYRKSVFISEGDILAATIDVVLSDVLRFASDVNEEDGVIQFTNANYSINNGHLFVNGGWLHVNLTNEKNDDEEDAPVVVLLNGGMYTTIKIESFSLNYIDGVFSGNYVIQSKSDHNLKKSYEFYFRTLN